MKRFYLILIKLFFIHVLFSQQGFVNPHTNELMNLKNQEVNQTQKEIIFPPLGQATKNNTFFVDHINCLFITDSAILIVNRETGKTEKKLSLINSDHKSYKLSDKTETNSSPATNPQDGWVTYAECEAFVHDPRPTYFSAEWAVPFPPLKKSDQLIYIFNGLVGTHSLSDSSTITYILQPVLQWGPSSAGGGKYWSICNWFVTSKGQYFHDSLIRVNSGDRLQGIVKIIARSDSTYTYNSSFFGHGEGLDVLNVKVLDLGYLALETYGVRNCKENPAEEKMRMFNIQMIVNDDYPPFKWQIFNNRTNCGAFTNVIDESSHNGEINIHFHKPPSEDNFEDIYIYPNPIQDILHISITNPIIRCRIDIYNSLGILMLTETLEILEYEYDLNLKNYPPGIYYIKFYYQKDIYTRETNHTFKFIKTNK
ncbi:MAG: T9SS type A sorting domain-containing protein [Chlorobi bacterium]|nr:T9SS type A sorting domain-containing protein [Chlorobiota bacterium]